MTLKVKDWPTVADQTSVYAKFSENNIYIGTLEGELLNLERRNEKFKQVRRTALHILAITSIAIPESNEFVVSTGLDGRCLISKPEGRGFTMIRKIKCDDASFPHCACSRDGHVIAIVGNKDYILIDKNQMQSKIEVGGDVLYDVAFYGINDEKLIAIGRHCIHVIDLESGAILHTINKESGSLKRVPHCVATHPSQSVIAIGTSSRMIEIWDVTSDEPHIQHEVPLPNERNGDIVHQVEQVVFSPDGRYLYAAGSNGTITVIDVATARIVSNLKSQRGRVFSLSVCPTGNEIVAVSDDKTVLLLSVEPEEQ